MPEAETSYTELYGVITLYDFSALQLQNSHALRMNKKALFFFPWLISVR